MYNRDVANLSLSTWTAPQEVPLVPVENPPLSSAELTEMCRVVLPPADMLRIPLSWLLHALRTWGRHAGLRLIKFVIPDFGGRWGEKALDLLTNDVEFARFCSLDGQLDHLFERSEAGIRVRTVLDYGKASYWASTHPGTYLQVMAEVGCHANTPIRVASEGLTFELSDVILDDAWRVHRDIELEWSATGLSRFLSTNHWKNRFGQIISFDMICAALLKQAIGEGACFGSHIPFALATILSIDNKVLLISTSIRRQVEKRLIAISAALAESQDSAGFWNPDWSHCVTGKRVRPKFSFGSLDIDRLAVTGHHLEWMTIATEDHRPPTGTISRATKYLFDQACLLKSALENDWHLMMPISHSVKAVLGICGHRFAADFEEHL